MRRLFTSMTAGSGAGLALAAMQRVALVCAMVVALAVLPAALAAFAGYDTYVVTGGSMAPAVRDGSLVVAGRVDPAAIAPGDVITFRHVDRPSVPVTHRVMQVVDDASGRFFQTKGDANVTADAELVAGDRPISRMSLTLPYAGWIVAALRTWPGQALLVALPALLLATRVIQQRRNSMTSAAWAVPPDTRAPQQVQEASMATHAHVTPHTATFGGERPGASWLRRLVRAIASRSMPSVSMPRVGASAAGASARRGSWDTERMQRLSAFLEAHATLTADLGGSLDGGMGPLRDLLGRHARNAARLEANLDRQLQPVREYADALEANLDRLLARLEREGSAASQVLRQQFALERERAREVRETIERTKAPLRAAIDRETAAIDALLAAFDPDLNQLERSLIGQRRDLMRVASGLRSDQLGEALGYLRDRSAELAGIAEAGIAEPEEIEATLRVSLERARAGQRTSAHLGRVLDALDAREERTEAA